MAAQSASSAEPVTSLGLALSPRANFFDAFPGAGKIRAGPVNLFAFKTATKLVVIDFGKRLEFVDYLRPSLSPSNGALHRRHLKGAINSKRSKRRITSIVCSPAFSRPRVISVLNDRMHEQTPITRQECSIFARHHIEQ